MDLAREEGDQLTCFFVSTPRGCASRLDHKGEGKK